MEIHFKSKKLKKHCENPGEAQRIYGSEIGTKLTQRVRELESAPNLAEIKNIPAARLHRLKGDRSNEFAVDLAHPFQLIFKPILESDANINVLDSITIVRISVEVVHPLGVEKR